MKTVLAMPPWGPQSPTRELMEALDIIGSNTTSIAKARFNQKKRKAYDEGKSAPKGMQSAINEVLDEKFEHAGWRVKDGRYFKNGTYVRISFRHAMSIGTDVLECFKEIKLEGAELTVLLACGIEALRKIAPSQAASMVSYEKLEKEITSLDGVIDMPLIIGELIPESL